MDWIKVKLKTAAEVWTIPGHQWPFFYLDILKLKLYLL